MLLDLLALSGLASYVQPIESDDAAFKAVLQEAEAVARAAGVPRQSWPDRRDGLLATWQRSSGPLVTLAEQLDLPRPSLFALALAAACERRAAVAFTVEALQAPAPGGRPTLHLTLALIDSLFPGSSPDAMAFAAGALVASGAMTLEGADVLPNRVLQLRLPLWRALDGGQCAWPGAQALPTADPGDQAAGWLDLAAGAIHDGRAGGVVLRGPPGSGRAAAAAALAARLQSAAIEVPAATLRDDAAFATACRAAQWLPVVRVAEGAGAVAVPGGIPIAVLAGSDGAVEGGRLLEFTLAPPSQAERTALWEAALAERSGEVDTELLAASVLYPGAIAAVAQAAVQRATRAGRRIAPADVAQARLAAAPDALRRLAQPVPPMAGAGVLVQTPALQQDLAALITRCRRREVAWANLGPTLHASRTRGVRAMFAGESGTGKTIAAAHVAAALAAPLYRCDLSMILNKYIGESEKNIGSLFDHAAAADVVLLIDEADALFGRRTDGGETGERFANMLTNYLLTRLESHGGIVILTTNAKARIDPAFWRRLDQVVDFPLPGYTERLALWRSHLGARAPGQEVLERLASYCDLPGGHVRNAVLAAAAAAEGDGPIGLELIAAGLKREYAKLGRALPAAIGIGPRAVA